MVCLRGRENSEGGSSPPLHFLIVTNMDCEGLESAAGPLTAFPAWSERGIANICIKNSLWCVMSPQTEFGGSVGKANVYECPGSQCRPPSSYDLFKEDICSFISFKFRICFSCHGKVSQVSLRVISVLQINPATFLRL